MSPRMVRAGLVATAVAVLVLLPALRVGSEPRLLSVRYFGPAARSVAAHHSRQRDQTRLLAEAGGGVGGAAAETASPPSQFAVQPAAAPRQPPTTAAVTTTTSPPAPPGVSADAVSNAPTYTTPVAPASPSAMPSATGFGCAAALQYLEDNANPAFGFECPGYADGHQAMTCVNVAGLCPNNQVIVISNPCPAAYMNEAWNSWHVPGGPIDPFGAC